MLHQEATIQKEPQVIATLCIISYYFIILFYLFFLQLLTGDQHDE